MGGVTTKLSPLRQGTRLYQHGSLQSLAKLENHTARHADGYDPLSTNDLTLPAPAGFKYVLRAAPRTTLNDGHATKEYHSACTTIPNKYIEHGLLRLS